MSCEIWKQGITNLISERSIVDQNKLNESYHLFDKTVFEEMDFYLKLPGVRK